MKEQEEKGREDNRKEWMPNKKRQKKGKVEVEFIGKEEREIKK